MGEESLGNGARSRSLMWGAAEFVALAAVALPALGYAVAYEFKLGQLRLMGLPYELLSLGLRDIIAGTLAVLFVGGLFFGLNTFFGLVVSGPDVPELERSLVRLLVPIGTLTVFYTMAGTLGGAGWLGLSTGFVLAAVGEFLPPLIRHRGTKGLEAKLKAYAAEDFDIRPTRISSLFGRHENLVGLLALIFLMFQISAPVGAASARARADFAVIHGRPERVVVAEYQGSLVSLTLDREHRRAMSPILVTPADDIQAGFYQEHLGVLEFQTRR